MVYNSVEYVQIGKIGHVMVLFRTHLSIIENFPQSFCVMALLVIS